MIENEIILENRGAENTKKKKYGPIKIIMAGESELMMHFRIYVEN